MDSNVTLWIRNTPFPLGGGTAQFGFREVDGYDFSVPDLDWAEDDEVAVVLSYERRLPSAPTNVSVTAPEGEDGTLEVRWDEPEHEGTFPIECYLVEFRHPSGEAKKRKQSYPGSRGTGKGCGDSPPTRVTRTDLEPGVQYQVLVQALSGDGFSEWSETKTLRTRGRSLRAWFESPPERHDGKKRVKVQVAFSEAIDGTPETVGEHGVDVDGGRVTSVRPVGGDAPGGAGNRSAGGGNAGREDREVVWEFEIEPDSDGDVTVSLDAGRPCGEPGAICTADGRSLSEGILTTVRGPEAEVQVPQEQQQPDQEEQEQPQEPPLTAAFVDMPAEHDGDSAFTLRMAFSEDIGISYRSLREDAFTVSGGRVTRGRRVNDRRDLFEMTVQPESSGDVTMTLPAGRPCAVSGAICTKGKNRRQLTNTPTATVLGPATPRHLTGSADDDTLSGRAGDDVLLGDAGDDTLDGDGGDDTLYGGDDEDDLYGGAGHDVLYGDDADSGAASGDDLLDGGSGDDTLYGDGGDDVLEGGADDDTLYGGSGNDDLYGDGGDDVLEGGSGDDSLTGGAGADTFVFAAGDGTDTITDFTPEEGDRIDLSAFAGLGGFASLTLTEDGSDTVLDLRAHGGGTVRLQGIAAADLLAADFLWP